MKSSNDPDVMTMRRIFHAAKSTAQNKPTSLPYWLDGRNDHTAYFQAGLAALKASNLATTVRVIDNVCAHFLPQIDGVDYPPCVLDAIHTMAVDAYYHKRAADNEVKL
jgi:hypothetical protein